MVCAFGKIVCPGGAARPHGAGSAAPGRTWAGQRGGGCAGGTERPPFPGLGLGFFRLSTIISLENIPEPGRELLGCPRAGWQPNGPAKHRLPRPSPRPSALPRAPPAARTYRWSLPPPSPSPVCLYCVRKRREFQKYS